MLKNINLINPGDSVIGYIHSKFPDGQQGITLSSQLKHIMKKTLTKSLLGHDT